MFNKYIDYLKDNPNNLWFKRKLYGWGWTPARWQGWAVIALFVVYLIGIAKDLGTVSEPTNTDLTWFFIKVAIAIAALLVIGYKTGEKPRWMWGLPKKDN
jgi:hypothetical protein